MQNLWCCSHHHIKTVTFVEFSLWQFYWFISGFVHVCFHLRTFEWSFSSVAKGLAWLIHASFIHKISAYIAVKKKKKMFSLPRCAYAPEQWWNENGWLQCTFKYNKSSYFFIIKVCVFVCIRKENLTG